MSEIKKGRGYVYAIRYHIVWCVKYRHKVLTGGVEERLRELLMKMAEDNGFTIVEYAADMDHVHLLIDCTPQHYIPDMLKGMKGVSARLLMKEYGDTLRKQLWDGHMWNPSYFVATVSENTEEQVRAYIQNQSLRDR